MQSTGKMRRPLRLLLLLASLSLLFAGAPAKIMVTAQDDADFFSNISNNSTNNSTHQANSANVDTTIVPVNCSPNRKEFTAITEMLLGGRTELLTLLERKLLKTEFMTIYNGLTTSNCDSYHRKIQKVNFLQMRNSSRTYEWNGYDALAADESEILDDWFGTTDKKADMNGASNTTRKLQQPTNAGSSTMGSLNATDLPSDVDIGILYEIVGSCRDCPHSNTGTFELYDDSFRRKLIDLASSSSSSSSSSKHGDAGVTIHFRTRMVTVRELEEDTNGNSSNNNTDDCVCLEGVEPKPQAPGVQECVDLMNERLPIVAEGTGQLYDLQLQDLVQIDGDDAAVGSFLEEATDDPSDSQSATLAATSGVTEAPSVEQEEEEDIAGTIMPTPNDDDGNDDDGDDNDDDETEATDDDENTWKESNTTTAVSRTPDKHPALRCNIWTRGCWRRRLFG